jgi:hydrogenase maturation protease
VRIIDFGIRGLDLMYALADGCDVAILIDAVPRGETPGTLFLLEPEIESISADATASPMLEAHSMDPVKVLRSAAAMGNLPAQIFIVGCEPSPLPEEDMQMEISAPVQASIEEAVAMVERIVHRFAGIRSDKLNEVLTVPALALSQELP